MLQFTEGPGLLRWRAIGRLGGDGNQRGLVALRLDPTINRVMTQVGFTADKPFGKRRTRIVDDLREWLVPIDTLCFFCPKCVRIVDRLLVEVLIVHTVPCHFYLLQKLSPGTRTQPSISTRALRLMMALVTLQSPFCSEASAPTRKVPDG